MFKKGAAAVLGIYAKTFSSKFLFKLSTFSWLSQCMSWLSWILSISLSESESLCFCGKCQLSLWTDGFIISRDDAVLSRFKTASTSVVTLTAAIAFVIKCGFVSQRVTVHCSEVLFCQLASISCYTYMCIVYCIAYMILICLKLWLQMRHLYSQLSLA